MLCVQQRYRDCGVCWVVWSSTVRDRFLMTTWQSSSNLQHESKNWLQLLQQRCRMDVTFLRVKGGQIDRQACRKREVGAWGGVFASLLHRLQFFNSVWSSTFLRRVLLNLVRLFSRFFSKLSGQDVFNLPYPSYLRRKDKYSLSPFFRS